MSRGEQKQCAFSDRKQVWGLIIGLPLLVFTLLNHIVIPHPGEVLLNIFLPSLWRDQIFSRQFLIDGIMFATTVPKLITSLLLYSGFTIFQYVLNRYLPLPAGTTPILDHQSIYRCNAFNSWIVTVLTVVYGPQQLMRQVTTACGGFTGSVFELIPSLFVISTVVSFILSSVCVYATKKKGKYNVVDYWNGVQLNYIFLGVDLKMLVEMRMSLIGLSSLTIICLQDHLSWYGIAFPHTDFLLVFMGVNLYLVDCLFNEQFMLSTIDVHTEKFGHMLSFGNLVYVPFSYALTVFYLTRNSAVAELQSTLSYSNTLYFLCCLCGYRIFRKSNTEKDNFRRVTGMKKGIETIYSSKSKKHILVDGWWAFSRKINYFGDLIMAWNWSLMSTHSAILGKSLLFFYPLQLTNLLYNRAIEDNLKCQQKHGKAWTIYCDTVPRMIIPNIFTFDFVMKFLRG